MLMPSFVPQLLFHASIAFYTPGSLIADHNEPADRSVPPRIPHCVAQICPDSVCTENTPKSPLNEADISSAERVCIHLASAGIG